MNIVGLWSDELTLGEVAQNNVKAFKERKARYLSKWSNALIKKVRTKILIESSLGDDNIVFYLDEHIFYLEPLKIVIDGIEKTYELSGPDKDYLMSEVIKHYVDEEKYPKLLCKTHVSRHNALLFSWDV